MKKIIISSLTIVALISTTSCKTDFDQDVASITISSGEADFSNYIALGNSLTSGYRDGALFSSGQEESYPAILATQMKKAGGGNFAQPLIPNEIGGFTNIPGFSGKLTLKVINNGLLPVPSAPAAELDKLSGNFNNMGVPGAKSFHLLADGYGNAAGLSLGKANPYFVRFASTPNTSVIKDAVAQKPTFFSLWIGNNDVLSYATSGGTGIDQTGNLNPTTYGSNDITDPNVMAASIKNILDALKSVGATKGVIANIPNITSIPFFTRVPAQPISGLSEAQVQALNTAYDTYNKGLAQAKSLGIISEAEYQKRLISFEAGAITNGAVIEDKDLKNLTRLGLPSYRQTTNEDFILLTTSSALANGGGTRVPLTDAQVLTATEAAKVKTATDAYNNSIATLASAYGLALVDAKTKMVELDSNAGILFDGVKYTAEFVTGGAFSLDGIHLTGRGYAIIANEFIKAINKQYKSNLPQVNPNQYSGIKFPAN